MKEIRETIRSRKRQISRQIFAYLDFFRYLYTRYDAPRAAAEGAKEAKKQGEKQGKNSEIKAKTAKNMAKSMISDEIPFKIRAYGRTELAQLYNPHLSPEAAFRKLMAWIRRYPRLSERLDQLGGAHARTWPPRAVAAIVEALGEP